MRPHTIALQSLISHLASLPGVQRLVLDERGTVLVVICDPATVRDDIGDTAAQRMSALGLTGLEVEVAYRGEHRDGARIRFIGVTREDRPDHSLSITVTLEWQGRHIPVALQAERGEPLELRTVALATLEAVSRIVKRDLELRVAGVKRVRSFDVDLMVASLFRTGAVRQQLVGAVLAGDDPHRAASLAVLSALNRLLGNYLSR